MRQNTLLFSILYPCIILPFLYALSLSFLEASRDTVSSVSRPRPPFVSTLSALVLSKVRSLRMRYCPLLRVLPLYGVLILCTLSALVLSKHTTITVQSLAVRSLVSHSFQWFRVFRSHSRLQ